MAIRRKTKKQEEEPLVDVVEAKETIESYFEKNKGLVLGLLTLIVLLVIGFIAYKYAYQAPRESSAKQELYRAEMQFEKDSFALALENPGGGFSGFLDIIDSYNGTKAANTAKYYAGVSYLQLGRFEEAVEYLKKFKPKGGFTPIMKHGALGDAYSELGEIDNAISAYKSATSKGDNSFLTPYYLNKLGLLLKKEGQSDGAIKAFKTIKDKYSKSNEAMRVDNYINALQAS